MKKKSIPFFIILIFLFIFVVFYKGLNDTNIYTPGLNKKSDIPFFDAKDFYTDKNINSLNIFKPDQAYLLNIWSSWCVPCRQEHKFLKVLSNENKINLIGMNYKDKKKNAKNFLNELGNPYDKIFVDLNGTISIEWGAYGVPESYLILNNKIIKKYIGPLNQQLINEIQLIIK
tara:strand:+ start:191 stop:709 length:519 start_codon:yes stop_codon:yes gene_type:complete